MQLRKLRHNLRQMQRDAGRGLSRAQVGTAGIWAGVLAALGLVVYYARTSVAHSDSERAAADHPRAGGMEHRPKAGRQPAAAGVQQRGEDGQAWRAKPGDRAEDMAEWPRRDLVYYGGRPQTKDPEPGGGHDEFDHQDLPVVTERKNWRARTWNKVYWATLVMGALMIVFPWLLGYTSDTYASLISLVLGAIVVIISVVGLLLGGRGTWEYWIIGLAGILAFVAPWVFGFEMLTGGLWAFIILGALITLFAGAEAFDIRVQFPS